MPAPQGRRWWPPAVAFHPQSPDAAKQLASLEIVNDDLGDIPMAPPVTRPLPSSSRVTTRSFVGGASSVAMLRHRLGVVPVLDEHGLAGSRGPQRAHPSHHIEARDARGLLVAGRGRVQFLRRPYKRGHIVTGSDRRFPSPLAKAAGCPKGCPQACLLRFSERNPTCSAGSATTPGTRVRTTPAVLRNALSTMCCAWAPLPAGARLGVPAFWALRARPRKRRPFDASGCMSLVALIAFDLVGRCGDCVHHSWSCLDVARLGRPWSTETTVHPPRPRVAQTRRRLRPHPRRLRRPPGSMVRLRPRAGRVRPRRASRSRAFACRANRFPSSKDSSPS